MKNVVKKLSAVVLAALFCMMLAGKVSYAAEEQAVVRDAYQAIGNCIVINNGAVLYDAPGGNALFRVRAGSEVMVVEENAQWVAVQYETGRLGYMNTGDVLLYDRLMTNRKEPGQLTQEWQDGEAWVQYLAASLAGLPPMEKVKALNGYLCDNITYDINAYTTYDALVNKAARCQGYSNAFERIMDAAGVPTDSVGGIVISEGAPVSHSWNRCLIDGQYYYVDVCWNDSSGRNDWLLISGGQMEQDHLPLLIRDEVE